MRGRRRAWALGLGLGAGLWGCDAQYVVGAAGLVELPGARLDGVPIAVALGDLDGDGALDGSVLLATQQLCVLRGQRDGSLAPGVCVPLAEPAAALAVSELGAPTQTAIFVAGQVLAAYTARPDLTPASAVRYPLTGGATALLPAYVKCDGRKDLGGCRRDVLVSDGTAGEVAVFLADAAGGLRGPQRFPVDPGPAALLFTDLDGDGAAELVTANRGAVPLTVFSQRGVATFTGCTDGRAQPALRRPSAVAALALEDAGSRVLIVADEDDASLHLLRVANLVPFALDCGVAARLPVAPDPLALATADFDGDGHDDLLIAHGSPPGLSLLRWVDGELQAPRFHPVGAAVRGLALGDLDHDGRPDVVVASSGDSTVRILRSAFR